MATAHNAFIGALAMSDLMLCTVTLPINLWKMFNERWIFGEQSQILCGFTMAAQKFPIFLSSMSIVVIGWDRYRGVITPERLVVNSVLGSSSITTILAAAPRKKSSKKWETSLFSCLQKFSTNLSPKSSFLLVFLGYFGPIP